MVVLDERRRPNLAGVVASFASLPHARFLGMRCDEIGPGHATLSIPYQDRLIGNCRSGVLHGGVITALLDTLSWLVVATTVPEDTAIAILDLRIDYLRPAQPGQSVRAAAQCYKITSNVAFTRGVAYHERREDPIAQSTGTCMVRSYPVAAEGGSDALDDAGVKAC